MNKHRLFFILWWIAVSIIIISTLSSWWYNSEERHEGSNTIKYSMKWTLSHVTVETESTTYAEEKYSVYYSDDPFDDKRIADVWLRTAVLVMLGIALHIGVLWVYFRYRKGKTNRQWIVTTTALAAVVSITIPIFVMFSVPYAVNEQYNSFYFSDSEHEYNTFWGDNEENLGNESDFIPVKMEFHWKPLFGWYISWAVFAIDIVLFFLTARPPTPTDADMHIGDKLIDQKAETAVVQQIRSDKIANKLYGLAKFNEDAVKATRRVRSDRI